MIMGADSATKLVPGEPVLLLLWFWGGAYLVERSIRHDRPFLPFLLAGSGGLIQQGEPIRQAQQCRFRPGGTNTARELLHHDMESMSHVCTLECNKTRLTRNLESVICTRWSGNLVGLPLGQYRRIGQMVKLANMSEFANQQIEAHATSTITV